MPVVSNRPLIAGSRRATQVSLLIVFLFVAVGLSGKTSGAVPPPPEKLTLARRIVVGKAALRAVSWSRFTREFICLDADGKVTAIRLDGAKRVFGTGFEAARFLVVSPDGTALAWGRADGRLEIGEISADRAGLSNRLVLSDRDTAPITSLDWSPDSHQLVCTAKGGLVRVWKRSGPLEERWRTEHPSPACVSWKPTGDEVALSGGDGLVTICDAGSGRAKRVIRPRTRGTDVRSPYPIAWTPDGSRLAVQRVQEGVLELWPGKGGGLAMPIPSQAATVFNIAWEPSGRLLAWNTSDQVFLWDTSTRKPVLIDSLPNDPISLGWNAAGSYLAIGTRNGSLVLVSMVGAQAKGRAIDISH